MSEEQQLNLIIHSYMFYTQGHVMLNSMYTCYLYTWTTVIENILFYLLQIYILIGI